MADKKISDLGDGGLPQPTDEFVVARGGTNNKIAWSSMSGGGGNGAAITISGNTAGAGALISTGTLTLAGGNNITLSQAGNAITISGANAGGAQTGISGLANSEATYTSGTVELVNSGAITISSDAGQKFVFSVDPQSVQPETQTFIAGISASNTLYTSGNVRISGSQAATVRSGTGQLVIIDVPVQSTQPETQTFLSGIIASDTTYTSGNVRITGVGGGVTVSSNTGQRVDISVAAQSVQPETQTFIGGISASNTLYTSGSVRFTGSNAVTVRSGTGQLVVIDAPTQTTQVETQTFVGAIVGSNATYTSGTVTFTGVGGGVTVSSNTGQRVDISVAAPVAQTNQSGNVYASSNTFGTSSGTYDARSISIAGRGDISVAASNSGWIISGPAQTNQAGSVYAISNTSGTSSGTYDARTLSIAGAGIVTVAASNSGWRIDASTAAQTNQSGNVYASSNTFGTSSGTYDARSISIAGRGAVSVAASNSGWIISAPAQTTQVETQTFIGGIVGSNATYTSGTVTITGVGGGVTVSSNTGQRIDISVAAPVAATNLSVGASTGGNTAGDTGVATGSRLVFAGGNNITVSQGTAAGATTITISAGAGGAYSAGMSTNGNTSGDTGFASQRLALIGGNNITLSGSTNAGSMSITISAPNLGAGAMSAGVSTGGNTAGSTGITGTQLVLVGTGPISLSQSTGANGGTVSFDAPATSSLSATGAVSISTNGSTISIGAAQHGTASRWPGMPQSTVSGALPAFFATAATRTSMTAYIAPYVIEMPLSVNEMRVPVYASITSANSNSNWSWTAGHSMGIYTLTGATMSLLSSFSFKQQISYASTNNSTNASATWSASWGSGTDLSGSLSLSTGNAGVTGFWSSISSMKLYPLFSGAMSVSPGQYFNAWVFSSASAGSANAIWTGVGLNVAVSSQQAAQDIGVNVSSTTGIHPYGGLVSMTQTNTAMPTSFLPSDMTTAGAAALALNRSVYFALHSA